MLIKAGPVIVTEAEILEFARKFDPQWFHTDPKRAAEGAGRADRQRLAYLRAGHAHGGGRCAA